MNELIDSNEFSETYETAMGIVTVWKKDGISTDGVKGKEGTTSMVYSGSEPIRMPLKRKYL
jgi:hypothetical protein